MLHAPIHDHKTKAEASSQSKFLSEQEQLIPLLDWRERSQREGLAVLQKTYGNQAILQMMGRSTIVTAPLSSQSEMPQRKCICSKSAETPVTYSNAWEEYDTSQKKSQQKASSRSRAKRLEDNTSVDQAEIEAFCIDIQPNSGPTRCEFTDRQRATLNPIKSSAIWLISRARLALGSGDRYMELLARQIFHLSEPDMTSIESRIVTTLRALRNAPILCGTCADETCNRPGVVAYADDDDIIVCPRFFLQNVTQMRRTLVHEAGHVAGIDAGSVYTTLNPERYCNEDSTIECRDPCSRLASTNLLENVDAWSRFVECAGFSY